MICKILVSTILSIVPSNGSLPSNTLDYYPRRGYFLYRQYPYTNKVFKKGDVVRPYWFDNGYYEIKVSTGKFPKESADIYHVPKKQVLIEKYKRLKED